VSGWRHNATNWRQILFCLIQNAIDRATGYPTPRDEMQKGVKWLEAKEKGWPDSRAPWMVKCITHLILGSKHEGCYILLGPTTRTKLVIQCSISQVAWGIGLGIKLVKLCLAFMLGTTTCWLAWGIAWLIGETMIPLIKKKRKKWKKGWPTCKVWKISNF